MPCATRPGRELKRMRSEGRGCVGDPRGYFLAISIQRKGDAIGFASYILAEDLTPRYGSTNEILGDCSVYDGLCPDQIAGIRLENQIDTGVGGGTPDANAKWLGVWRRCDYLHVK